MVSRAAVLVLMCCVTGAGAWGYRDWAKKDGGSSAGAPRTQTAPPQPVPMQAPPSKSPATPSVCPATPQPSDELLHWVSRQYVRWVRRELLPAQDELLSRPPVNNGVEFPKWSIEIARQQQMTVAEWEAMVRGASERDIDELVDLLAKDGFI